MGDLTQGGSTSGGGKEEGNGKQGGSEGIEKGVEMLNPLVFQRSPASWLDIAPQMPIIAMGVSYDVAPQSA